MDIRKMETIVAIAELGSFSRAASACNLTQSAVSQQMKELESYLDITLFDRDSKPPKLTIDGQAYVELAHSILKKHRNFISIRSQKEVAGILTVGAVRSALNLILPNALKSLSTNYPRLKMRLINSGRLSNDLVNLVSGHQIDVALIVGPPQNTELVWKPYAKEFFYVVAPITTRGKSAEELLTACPYIRFVPNLPVEYQIEKELEKRKLHLESNIEVDTFESILLLASEGLGAGIVPEKYIAIADSRKLRFAPFGIPNFFRELGIIHINECSKITLIDILLNLLKNNEFNSNFSRSKNLGSIEQQEFQEF